MVTTRYRKPAPAIPFIFLHCLADETITTTPTAINWAHAHFITSDFHYTAGEGRITMNRGSTGMFKLYAQIGAIKATGAPTELTISLYINGTLQDCCTVHGGISAQEHTDVTLIAAFQANMGDYIEIYVNVDNGTSTTESETARLIIEGLPMKGWNNNAGGKEHSKSGVVV